MAGLRSFRFVDFQLLTFIWSLILFSKVEADSTLSIVSLPAFSSVHPCVQRCLYCGEYWLINCPGHADGLNNVLSCNNLDSLFCRTDLEESASSYLTTCIYSQCTTNSIDLLDGLSLYNGYCNIDGATLNNYPSASATTTHESTHQTVAPSSVDSGSNPDPSTITTAATPGSTPTISVISTVTSGSSSRATVTSTLESTSSIRPVTIHSTTTVSPNSVKASSGGGLSTDNKITVACSILGVILAFLALFAGRRWWKSRDDDEGHTPA